MKNPRVSSLSQVFCVFPINDMFPVSTDILYPRTARAPTHDRRNQEPLYRNHPLATAISLTIGACIGESTGIDSRESIQEKQELESIKQRAEQGDAEAQYRLGSRYVLGYGVPEDDAEAAKWFQKVAEQGHASSPWIKAASRLSNAFLVHF